ncbi:MAG TPA: hypothetical protein VGN00_05640 [Puia sp.]|jgi:hypothetical protein
MTTYIGCTAIVAQCDPLYHIQSWPTSFVIDKKGVVRYAGGYDEKVGSVLSAVIDHAL